MKKIKLLIPMLGKRYFELYIFDLSWKNNTLGTILLKSLYFFGYLTLFLIFLLLSFSDLLTTSLDSDSAVLRFLIYMIPIAVGIFLSIAILNGRRKFIDPPFFLVILLFALGTTTSSVLVSVPSLSNTFGSTNIRGLAGITIIALVSFYYLSTIYLHNRELFRRAFKLLILGIIVSLVLGFLNDTSNLMSFVNITLGLAAIGGIFVLTKSTPHLKLLKLLAALTLILMFIYSFIENKTTFVSLNFILIPLTISFTVILLTFYLSKRSIFKVILADTKRDLKILKDRSLRIWELARITSIWIIILMPLLLILTLIFINAGNSTGIKFITDALSSNVNSFSSIIDFAQSNFGTFLFGVGSESLRPSTSFISNVILTQGFLGLASYLFLITYTIMTIARYVYFNFKTGGNYIIPSFLLFLSTLITFESFFFYIGMKLIFIWWVCLALTAVKYMHKTKKNYVMLKDKDFEISELNVAGNKLPLFAKYALVVILLIGSLYVASSLGTIVK